MINIFGLKIKRSISSALKRNTRNRIFHNLENMERILIFFTYGDWPEISQIVHDLENKKKTVFLWTMEPKKLDTKDIIFPANVRIITQKEMSIIHGLPPAIAEEFRRLSYDTLIDLTTHDDKSLLYLLAGTTAEFCIGIREQEYKMYDFTLLKEDDMNLLETYEQIKFYLNNVR
ncbi:hypothetical protein M2451_001741 [Dysgonomonas sp. PFB1-18]|uniref:DUF6913 domain-containing protein n=1 Tax=unclassified Dysgonomonas TaxID=2630389 RepID=UPI0024763C1C|nr:MULTISPECIES: hypothetical protein [unclassified Dysgonomonas]MDH6309170.1 hypothetical protein [Dysgonomonas sp. PF1-14]MDH6338950.1 hypothetical protein [Dysgonomonas sp. PF1-16]MDH6380419.1 hypothetical protein [Dysgonomonas sp. PFB1-18]MDH6397778.1 hypothetical protein [Dysgonomonas sp. PF1-23]